MFVLCKHCIESVSQFSCTVSILWYMYQKIVAFSPGRVITGIAKPPMGLVLIFKFVGIGPMEGGDLVQRMKDTYDYSESPCNNAKWNNSSWRRVQIMSGVEKHHGIYDSSHVFLTDYNKVITHVCFLVFFFSFSAFLVLVLSFFALGFFFEDFLLLTVLFASLMSAPSAPVNCCCWSSASSGLLVC